MFQSASSGRIPRFIIPLTCALRFQSTTGGSDKDGSSGTKKSRIELTPSLFRKPLPKTHSTPGVPESAGKAPRRQDDVPVPALSRATQPLGVGNRVQTAELDPEVDDIGVESMLSVQSGGAGAGSKPVTEFVRETISLAEAKGDTVLQHHLLDDTETYFPPLQQPDQKKAVPGQRLVDPGYSRFRFEVQYRGSAFDGWSKSTARRKEIEAKKKGAMLLRPAGEAIHDALAVACDLNTVKIVPSAVPEIGVHVRKLTCHVDLPHTVLMQPRVLLQRAHAWMAKKGEEGGILTFARARDDFQAKHSATRRVYCYRILNRIAPPLFEGKGMQWHVDRYLDAAKMQRGARLMEGKKDFRAFADQRLAWAIKKSGIDPLDFTVKTVEKVEVTRQEDEILIWIVGTSFLRQQIRTMVGVLKLFGQGVWQDRDLETFMASGGLQESTSRGELITDSTSKRYKKSFTSALVAPRHGLTLWEVQYPSSLPAEAPLDSGPLDLEDFTEEEEKEEE